MVMSDVRITDTVRIREGVRIRVGSFGLLTVRVTD